MATSSSADGVVVGDIALESLDAWGVFGRGVEPRAIPAGDDDVRSGARECLRNVQTDARRPSGDDCQLSVYLHDFLPLLPAGRRAGPRGTVETNMPSDIKTRGTWRASHIVRTASASCAE